MPNPKPCYIRTIPHTGTHFLFALFRECASPNHFHLEGVHQGLTFGKTHIKTSAYMRNVISGRITFEKMMSMLMGVYGCPKETKYLGLFEHLALPGTPPYHENDVWIYDFERNNIPGYPVKTIMSLRHPLETVLSIMVQTIGMRKQRNDALNWTREGFEFIAEHYKQENYFIIPVDALGRLTARQRLDYLKKLFEVFLGIDYNVKKLSKFCDRWKPENTIDKKKKRIRQACLKYNNMPEFELLLKYKSDLRYYRRSENLTFDREVDFYLIKNELIKGLLVEHGYVT